MTTSWPMRLTTVEKMLSMKGSQKPSFSNRKLLRGGPMVRLDNAQGMNVGMNDCVPTLMKSLSWPDQLSCVDCKLEYCAIWGFGPTSAK